MGQVAVPSVVRWDFIRDADDVWAQKDDDAAGKGERLELVPDVFLYEAAMGDITSRDDVWGFAAALHGSVVPWSGYRFADVNVEDWRDYLNLLGPYADALESPLQPRRDVARMKSGRVHVAEVAVRQQLLRDLSALVTGDWQTGDVDMWDRQESLDRATAALRAFSPSFGLTMRSEAFDVARSGTEIGVRFSHPSGYQVAVLQAFNRATSGVQPRICARQPCGRRFYAQRDRATHAESESHRRSDAIYCSKACARRAAQKAYADRKRAK